MYKVIREFHDLEDSVAVKGGRIYQHYEVGDVYPRPGFSPSEGRIALLAGPDNAQGVPLIKLVNEMPAQEPEQEMSVSNGPAADEPDPEVPAKTGRRKAGAKASGK